MLTEYDCGYDVYGASTSASTISIKYGSATDAYGAYAVTIKKPNFKYTTNATTASFFIESDTTSNWYKSPYLSVKSDWCYTSATRSNTWYDCDYQAQLKSVRKTPKEQLQEILQLRQSPAIISSRKSLALPVDIREIRARETLKRILGEEKFRRFIKDGFVSVQAKSGFVYQIFPAHGITNVYFNGEKIERLCVVLRGDFPATDSLIMRYLLILNDEQDFRKQAIQHKIQVVPKLQLEVNEASLNEIWRKLKKAA